MPDIRRLRPRDLTAVAVDEFDFQGRREFILSEWGGPGRDVTGSDFANLLRFGLERCDRFLLLDPRQADPDDPCDPPAEFQPFVLDRYFSCVWPETMRGGAGGLVWECRFNEASLIELQRLGSLFSMGAVEDLCLLRFDDAPLLWSSTHERLAALDVTDAEWREIRALNPTMWYEAHPVGLPRHSSGPRPHRGVLWAHVLQEEKESRMLDFDA